MLVLGWSLCITVYLSQTKSSHHVVTISCPRSALAIHTLSSHHHRMLVQRSRNSHRILSCLCSAFAIHTSPSRARTALSQFTRHATCLSHSRNIVASHAGAALSQFTPHHFAAFACSCSALAIHIDRKSTRLNSSHSGISRMPSSA